MTDDKVVLAAQQRALTAAVERIKTAAKREARDLTVEEVAHVDALAATLTMLTRDINRVALLPTSTGNADAQRRGHAQARGPPPSGDGEALLRWRQVSDRTGLSRASIWRLVRAGRFPRPVQIMGPSTVGWVGSEIAAWVESRVRQRDHQEPRRSPASRGRPRKPASAQSTIPDV